MNEMPEIGPGNGYALFEEIDSLDIRPKSYDHVKSSWIHDCKFESLQNTADELCMVSPFLWKPVRNPFSFLASSSLSGAVNTCFDPSCRISRAKALGRFAALYADTVLIRDPFEGILNEEDSDKLRLDFAITLEVLESLRAEIEAGVVLFAPTDFPLCEDGLKKFSQVELAIKEQVFNASDQIIEHVIEQLEVNVVSKAENDCISIRGTEEFDSHSKISIFNLDVRSRLGNGQKLTKDEVRGVVQRWILDPSLIDLQYRHIISWLYDVKYLTDRPVDADLLRVLGENAGLRPPQLSAQANHPLPFVDGLDTKTLLKLRQDDGEAFQVYRDRVRALFEKWAPTAGEFK